MGDDRFVKVEKKDAAASPKKKPFCGEYQGNKLQSGSGIVIKEV